jgi:hypothetical protein
MKIGNIAIAIIGLVLGLYVLSALGPGAIMNLVEASTTSFTAPMIALWGLLSLVVILAFVMLILRYVR